MVIGCHRQPIPEQDLDKGAALAILKNLVERYPADVRDRAKSALLELDDAGMAGKPIMVTAMLMQVKDAFALAITCFDKDRNLRGIRIKEEREDANGVISTILEDYPVFVAFADGLKSGTVERRLIPFQIRKGQERKDEIQWLQYENHVLDTLIQGAVTRAKPDESLVDILSGSPVGMPPAYISIPAGKRLRVQVSAYDRAGRSSEWIDVRPEVRWFLDGEYRGRPPIILLTRAGPAW
jgi:hypothetical protein